MFLQLLFHGAANLQRTVLVLNTVILIATLIVVELVYGEKPKAEKKHLKDFYPIFIVLGGVLLFAIVKQVGAS